MISLNPSQGQYLRRVHLDAPAKRIEYWCVETHAAIMSGRTSAAIHKTMRFLFGTIRDKSQVWPIYCVIIQWRKRPFLLSKFRRVRR